MAERHLVVVGGGLAGLSTGVYALRNGFDVTVVEHNLTLGGVCTAWHRGDYTVDGCIHWLTGGPFTQIYEELGILPAVPLHTLDTWATYRNVLEGVEVPITRDLDALVARLSEISPKDGDELSRMRQGARDFVAMKPPLDAEELLSFRDGIRMAWEMRGALSTLVHFRKSAGEWANEHLSSPLIRGMVRRLVPDTAPAMFLLMVLGYLERGYLSRPRGGTAAFRDALEKSFRDLGGEVQLHATVDEILVTAGRASGVRLADGRILDADIVVSTASAPETVLRLLGGRYDADTTRKRLEEWKLFDPIVLGSFGVEQPYRETPSLLLIDRVQPFDVGGRANDSLYVRTCNDDPCFAPEGHSVVQVMAPTTYDFWATRGARYQEEKDETAQRLLDQLSPHFPELRAKLRMIDLATPLTYWGMARSWRGAYEGWMPTSESFFGHVKKTLPGLEGFYMAGQWVEPGGGVPTAVMSGRKVVQLVCASEKRQFFPE
jgi:phytoene dehydrogenase-like protein